MAESIWGCMKTIPYKPLGRDPWIAGGIGVITGFCAMLCQYSWFAMSWRGPVYFFQFGVVALAVVLIVRVWRYPESSHCMVCGLCAGFGYFVPHIIDALRTARWTGEWATGPYVFLIGFLAVLSGVAYAIGSVVAAFFFRIWRRVESPPEWLVHANCRSCGYSLKHLTVPRCPECGTPFDQSIVISPDDSGE